MSPFRMSSAVLFPVFNSEICAVPWETGLGLWRLWNRGSFWDGLKHYRVKLQSFQPYAYSTGENLPPVEGVREGEKDIQQTDKDIHLQSHSFHRELQSRWEEVNCGWKWATISQKSFEFIMDWEIEFSRYQTIMPESVQGQAVRTIKLF